MKKPTENKPVPQLTCKGCTKRYLGCHSHCEEYLAWQEYHLAEKAKEREENNAYRSSYNSPWGRGSTVEKINRKKKGK